MTLQELHHKLGHASEEKLLNLINRDMISGISLTGPRSLLDCYACAVGK